MNQLYTEILPDDPLWDETYPRPQMVRDNWQSLDGTWEFENGTTFIVPYCNESVLSEATFKPVAGYTVRKKFYLQDDLKDDIILLHLDAIDEFAEVIINGKYLGFHDNGYLPFTYVIPREELAGKENEIRINTADTTDLKFPYGKQRKNRGGMWYTAVSGIWQSIWLESVPKDYIVKVKTTTEMIRY